MNDTNESTTESTTEPKPANPKKSPVTKPILLLTGSVMVMPALIPLWFAIQADSTQMLLVFTAMSFVLVVVNILLLYVIYRWLQLF